MSNLWNLQDLQGNTEIIVAGDTIPAMFWQAAAQRADQVWLRQKELGIWRSWTWQDCANTVQDLGQISAPTRCGCGKRNWAFGAVGLGKIAPTRCKTWAMA